MKKPCKALHWSRPEKAESMGGGTVASGAPIVDTKSKEYRRDKAFLSIINNHHIL